MCKDRRVSFSLKVEVIEFTPVDRDSLQDLYYTKKDFERFQEDENKRWEKAISKRLQKLGIRMEDAGELLSNRNLKNENCDSSDDSGRQTPLTTNEGSLKMESPYKMASAA
jgi:hypothetical protein